MQNNDIQFLREAWQTIDVAAVEKRFGVTFDHAPAPINEPDPEGWRVEHAREWIANQRHRVFPRFKLELLAKRLILAYLEPDPLDQEIYAECIRSDAGGIDPHYFALASQAAKEAAQHYSPQARPKVRAKLLSEIDELVMA